MRKAALLCMVLAFVSGSAYGLTYTWINASTNTGDRSWQTGTNWNLGKAPTTGDIAIVANGGKFTSTANILVGELRMRNNSDYNIGSFTLTMTNDNGATGNYWYGGYAVLNLPDSSNIVRAYGNAWMDCGSGTTGWWVWPGTVELYGTNTAFRQNSARNGATVVVYGTGIWDNGSYNATAGGSVTVEVGGSIGARPGGVASLWSTRAYTFKGGPSNLPAAGAPVDFQYAPANGDNGGYKLVVAGGVTYPRDLLVNYNAWDSTNPKNATTWRVKGGDVTVSRDLVLAHYTDQIAHHFSTIENGTATSRNLNVRRDLKVGTNTGSATRIDMIWLNNSTVDIDCNLIFGTAATGTNRPNGSGDLGGATIYLGRDLTIADPHNVDPSYMRTINAWSAGASTIICDGNGTVAGRGRQNQVLTTNSYRGFKLLKLTDFFRQPPAVSAL